ncbi:hypothetical protein Y032_0040g300 [Ancylostoma ceylanicum]|uniref:Uncharacterized protein n=1 Tax=Ancylostoma ceylanicum TaxID=53326 RepID=A0A016UHH6_9BILA|nr:hypothetical protein Y032_0040g300 [Ancylostoma ceylanicum]
MLTKVKGEPQAAEEAWPAVNISAKNRFCCSIPSASYTPGEECSGLVWEFLTDPDEQSLPNCHFVDPDKIIKHLLNGSGPLGQPNSSDICEFFQKFDDDTKLLVSSSWLTRAIQSSPNFGEQEEALAKFILVRNAINDFEERKKCYRKGKKVANLHGSNHPARSRRKSRNPKKIELMESGPSSFQTNGHETTRVCHTQNGFVLDATNRSPSSSALNTSTSRDGEGSHSYAQPPSPSCKQMMTVSDMKKLLKELFPNRHQALVKHVLSLIWSSKTNDMTQKELIVLLGLKNTKFIERIMQVRDSIKESGDSLLTDLDFNSQFLMNAIEKDKSMMRLGTYPIPA